MPKNNKKKTYQKPTQEQIQYLHNKSKVHNTEKSTLNWIQKFQKYHSDVGLEGAAEEVDNANKLEVQLCEYFTIAEKGDGSPYSVLSLLAAIKAINRFYNLIVSKVRPINLCDRQAFPDLWTVLNSKTKDLSEKGYSETNRSDGLTFEEIRTILNYEKYFLKKPVDANLEFYLYPIGTKTAP
ncbi:30469_t:CDS:2, partial [Gigaspora margarita]